MVRAFLRPKPIALQAGKILPPVERTVDEQPVAVGRAAGDAVEEGYEMRSHGGAGEDLCLPSREGNRRGSPPRRGAGDRGSPCADGYEESRIDRKQVPDPDVDMAGERERRYTRTKRNSGATR